MNVKTSHSYPKNSLEVRCHSRGHRIVAFSQSNLQILFSVNLIKGMIPAISSWINEMDIPPNPNLYLWKVGHYIDIFYQFKALGLIVKWHRTCCPQEQFMRFPASALLFSHFPVPTGSFAAAGPSFLHQGMGEVKVSSEGTESDWHQQGAFTRMVRMGLKWGTL